jgi:hypothetical protein
MRHTFLFLCFCSLLAGSAVGWGPAAHVTLGRAVLHRIQSNPEHPLGFLAVEPYRTIFLRSTMSPDMTLSLFRGRKLNVRYNGFFHNDAVSELMVKDAASRHSWEQLAFALGWRSHRIADHAVSQPGSVIYRNLFGFSRDEMKTLQLALTELNKFCIDCVMIRDHQTEAMEPYVDTPLLAKSLQSYFETKQITAEDPRKLIPEYFSDFKWSCSTLFTVAESISVNRKAFPALASELIGDESDEQDQGAAQERDPTEFPMFEDTVDAMEGSLVNVMRGQDLPEVQEFERAKPQGKPTFAERAERKVKKMATAGTRYLWNDMTITRKLRQVVVDQSVRLINSVGSDGSVRQRLLLTFAADMVNGTRDWAQVKEHVHHMVNKSKEEKGKE